MVSRYDLVQIFSVQQLGTVVAEDTIRQILVRLNDALNKTGQYQDTKFVSDVFTADCFRNIREPLFDNKSTQKVWIFLESIYIVAKHFRL